MAYRTSMEAFQYCPVKYCAVEIDASTIASDDSFDYDFAKCRFTGDLIEIPCEIEFDLTHQVSLHVCADICGILGYVNKDSGTVRSNLSTATLATSQLVLPIPINYLVQIQTPRSASVSTKENQTVPTATMTEPTSKEDAQDLLIPPAATPSVEEASSDKSKESSDN